MAKQLQTVSLSFALVFSANALAFDARSIALGGSNISNVSGAYGVLANPASLMQQKNLGQRYHLHFGASVDLRDSANLADIADENSDLQDDFDDEIDAISGQTVSCNVLTATDDSVCLTGTAELGDLSSQVLDILNDIDQQQIDGQGVTNIGFANSNAKIPFAVHYQLSGTIIATPIVAESDIAYAEVFANTLQDGDLTFGEINNNSEFLVETDGTTLSLSLPEDTLQSETEFAALIRNQIGISLSRTMTLGGHDYDFGITPKFSRLQAGFVNVNIADQFEDNSESIEDRFDDSERTGSSATFDFGMSTQLPSKPVRVAAVVRNVLTESITIDDYKFETTPQLIVAGSYQWDNTTINADLALNSAKIDNFETQKMGIGVEWQKGLLSLRGGISHDNERSGDSTAASVGLGIGVFHIGARLADTNNAQFSAQLSHSF